MSSHQTNKDKPRSSKCRHFCFPFDTHNYSPTCRESGKGDDPCVTFENPCQICGSFTEEQMLKISQRKRYIKKQKALTATSKDELDLLGDDVESFTGSNADLESAHMRPFQFHLKEHWRYPQLLDSLLPWTEAIAAYLDWWQNPSNVMRGADLHPKDHSIQLFTDASNEGWGPHLDQSSTKGLWSDQEKGYT